MHGLYKYLDYSANIITTILEDRFTPEDYRALTPLFSGHINPYGLFPLDFNKRIVIG